MSQITIRCEICQESIALADTDTLRKPLKGSMFKTADAWHGVPDPFTPETEWEFMKCPFGQHRPFVSEDRVLLDDGEWMEVGYVTEPELPSTGEPGIELIPCHICDFQAKSNAGLAAHMRRHNG